MQVLKKKNDNYKYFKLYKNNLYGLLRNLIILKLFKKKLNFFNIMDPSILKSLQKIEELVKNKRNIIEQIPNKSNIDVAQIIPQMTLVSQNPASINTLNPLNNVMNLTNFHHDNNLFMNRVNPQTNISFNDGILLPNQLESNLNFFNENENKALNGKNSLLSIYFL